MNREAIKALRNMAYDDGNLYLATLCEIAMDRTGSAKENLQGRDMYDADTDTTYRLHMNIAQGAIIRGLLADGDAEAKALELIQASDW